MVNIDYIMECLDWNNPPDVQKKGIEMAKEVKCLNVFFQPHDDRYSKNVWDNCAIILSERSDEELRVYLYKLIEWLQDMNWPGAYCIERRLKAFQRDAYFEHCIRKAWKLSRLLHDSMWESELEEAFPELTVAKKAT